MAGVRTSSRRRRAALESRPTPAAGQGRISRSRSALLAVAQAAAFCHGRFFPEAHMAGRWYYAHDDNKFGPFSGRELRDLIDAGHLLPTDTVWKDGIDKRVFTNRVRYLF